MITSNVIYRVFRISFGSMAGSAFAIDVEDRQYLVTAKHVVANLVGDTQIGIFAKGSWTVLPVRLVGHAPGETDISVLAADRRLTPGSLPLEATQNGIVYGQDVYFLGFPYDILSRFIMAGEGYPLPLTKKAIVSCFDHNRLLLDGHNNSGFSGGPVVFKEPGKQNFKVAAVISGYRAVEEPIYASGEPTSYVYNYNTGIIVTYSIDRALELIKANPVGFQLGAV